jgi:hypothetical protein
MTQNVVVLPRLEKKNQGKIKCLAKSVPYAALVAEKDRQSSGPALIIGHRRCYLSRPYLQSIGFPLREKCVKMRYYGDHR